MRIVNKNHTSLFVYDHRHNIAQYAQYCAAGAILRCRCKVALKVQYCAVDAILRMLRNNIAR